MLIDSGSYGIGKGAGSVSIAPFLLLFCLACLLSQGCGKKTAARIPTRFVRIDALLSLHSAWGQVVMLDQNLSRLQSAQFVPVGVSLNKLPLPADFAPPQTVPTNLVEARERRLQEDVAHYIRYFSQQLDQRNQVIFAHYAETQRAALETDYHNKLTALTHKLEEERAAKASELSAQIDRLRLRDVALETQVQAYRDQPGADAQQQQKRLETEIAQLMDQHNALLADAEPEARAALAGEYQQMQIALNERLKQKQQELARDAEQAVATEEARLRNQPAPVLPIGSTPPTAFASNSVPLPLPGSREIQGFLIEAEDRQRSLTSSVLQAWAKHRAELISQIRSDILRMVQEEARREGWRLAPVNTPGAEDATEAAKAFITAQQRQDGIR